MNAVLILLALFFILGTGFSLLTFDHWTIRFFDFPRVQLVVGAALTLGVYLFYGVEYFFEYGVLGVLGLSLAYQVYRIYPYTPLASVEVHAAIRGDDSERLSVLVSNVELPNREADALLQLIDENQPDLVLTLEPDTWWLDQLQPLEETYPYSVKQPQDNSYGMTLHSRRPLIDSEVRFIVDEKIPSIHTQVELPSGRQVYVHCMHPRPPHPVREEGTTERDAELLILGRKIKDRDAPTIVVGDLNDVSWSYTTQLFQRISGLLDPRVGRGTYNTFHARYPLLRYPLDHAFHSEHFKLVRLECLPYIGSDHFPVLLEVEYDSSAEYEQEEPEPEVEDRRQATREIEKLEEEETVPGNDSRVDDQ